VQNDKGGIFQMGFGKKKKKKKKKKRKRTRQGSKKKIIRLLKEKKVKAKQYELLPEEAAGLSVVLTVRYICKGIGKHCKDIFQHLDDQIKTYDPKIIIIM
jgi:hypothetical protein